MKNLGQEDWIEGTRSSQAVIIDVRSADECEEGIIAGAQMLDIYRPEEFMAALEELPKDKSYYLYCRSGNRSGQACQIMKSKGFDEVYNLIGGILEWEGELIDP